MNMLASYKSGLKMARGELVSTRASVLPFCEVVPDATPEQQALATVARGVSTIAHILIRVIDSLPGPSLTGG